MLFLAGIWSLMLLPTLLAPVVVQPGGRSWARAVGAPSSPSTATLTCGSSVPQGDIQAFGTNLCGRELREVSEFSSASVGFAVPKLSCRNPGSCSQGLAVLVAGLAPCPGRRAGHCLFWGLPCAAARQVWGSGLCPVCSPAAFPGICWLGNGDVFQPRASCPG